MPHKKRDLVEKNMIPVFQIEVLATSSVNIIFPSCNSTLEPRTYNHKQLNAKWESEKWINIGVISLHHSLAFIKVSSKVRKLK